MTAAQRQALNGKLRRRHLLSGAARDMRRMERGTSAPVMDGLFRALLVDPEPVDLTAEAVEVDSDGIEVAS